MEGTIGRPHGKRAAVSEGGGLATMSALSHFEIPFLPNNTFFLERAAYFTTIRILIQGKLLIMIRG
jgi:hypothetical protein